MAKRRQAEIPGTERDTVPELDELASPYCETMYERLTLQSAEKDLRVQLLERMKALKHKTYTYVDGEYEYTFHVKPSAKLETKRRKVGDESPDETPGDDE